MTVGLWSAWAAVTLRAAARDLVAASNDIGSVRGTSLDAILEGAAVPTLEAAQLRLERARAHLGSVPVRPLRAVPVLGRQLRSLSALSSSAADALGVGAQTARDAKALLDAAPADPGHRPTLIRGLRDLAARADGQLAGLRFGPRTGLLPRIARARNELTGELDAVRTGLRRVEVGGGAAADVLAGPRRYLLFAANNAEMRAGAGMFLSAGELLTGPDGLRLGDVRSVTEIPVPAEAVALSGDLAERWGWLAPNTEWRNLMLSPRFDVNAALAAKMWVAAGNEPVDGVLAIDPITLRGLLSATGPVSVDGRSLDRDNIVSELLHDQYLRYPVTDQASDRDRRDQLGQIARAVFDAVEQRQPAIGKLIGRLAGAVQGRHLLLWSSRPEEQAAWEALAVDGSLRPDSLLVSLVNRSGTKLDQFMRVSAALSSVADGAELDVTLRLDLENRAPEGEPPYVVGPQPGSGAGEGVYLGLLTVNLPGAARDGRFDGVEHLAVAGGDGPSRVVGFQVQLGRGERRTVVARFRLPRPARALRIEPSGRVPPVHWRAGGKEWLDESDQTVSAGR